jgi:hypothetical protein
MQQKNPKIDKNELLLIQIIKMIAFVNVWVWHIEHNRSCFAEIHSDDPCSKAALCFRLFGFVPPPGNYAKTHKKRKDKST